MIRSTTLVALAAMTTACASGTAGNTGRDAPAKITAAKPGAPPLPRFDGVDHAHPERYLALDASVGLRAAIEAAARDIPTESDGEKQLLAIGASLRTRLRMREADAYAWRDASAVLRDGTYGGCADHALVFGALARAKGIPTAWVKTLDADFIREFARAKGKVSSWRGHVFLEVFIDGRWALLDAMNLVLYRDYDPRQRILPGNRYAYDKGGAPFDLVLSPRWELWRAQTAAFIGDFDLRVLPVGQGKILGAEAGTQSQPTALPSERLRALPQPAFVVANRPYYIEIEDRLRSGGVAVGGSFNGHFDEQLARTVGHTLIVTVVGDQFVLPERYWPDTTVIGVEDVRRRMGETASGIFDRTRSDGTHVVVIYGRAPSDLERAIAGL